MSKKKNKTKVHADEQELAQAQLETPDDGEGTQSEPEAEATPPPARDSNDLSDITKAALANITHCTPAQKKHAAAVLDHVTKEVAVQLATLWPDICDACNDASEDGDKAAKTNVGVTIVINQTNLDVVDVKITTKTGITKKVSSDWQEDIRQSKFKIE